MNKSKTTITVKLIDIYNAPLIGSWKMMCDKYNVNPYCINEGLSDENSTIDISLEDAEIYGLFEY